MKRPNQDGKRILPPPGGEVSLTVEGGPLIYPMPMPPVKSRGRLIPAGDGAAVPPLGARVSSEIVDVGPPLTPEQLRVWREERGIPAPDRPLVPAAAELAKLPAAARAAFLARCAARVAPLAGTPAPTALDPAAAAALLVAAATVETPIRLQLRCVRRDFDRIAYLAKKRKWTDATPVPPEAFGPMWPKGFAPAWAAG